ncbi:MAG: DEAD/DEAH box helicase family protein [Candidatus Rokubacteria bacterium]|nr:DEAD/DEAH box helicase family protein [Candidatus Rokubacteria bacterium]
MSEQTATDRAKAPIAPNDKVRLPSYPELSIGEVLRIAETAGFYQADVVFETPTGRRLETFPVELLEKTGDPWQRLAEGAFDDPVTYQVKQIAIDLAHSNFGGELSASRVNLLPHQILVVHDLVGMAERRLLVADEVGLGKTIETGMLLRELHVRGESDRVLIVAPAGLVKNWQNELRDCFRLHFSILGHDFYDYGTASWEMHPWVIASIDTLKQPRRIQRLLGALRWDVIVFDEAHHLSRTRTGKKTVTTQNYKLAEALRSHTRDLLFLSATPHQGNPYQFWSLIQVLNDQLFTSPEELSDHRGMLARVMIRRTKREVTDAQGHPIFRRRHVHTERFPLAPSEREFYDRLSEYLREGYTVAGIDQSRTTRQQRAIGFVMATFQKIMSSSPRAIRQALRRRLLVLLARKQLGLEAKRRSGAATSEAILKIQDEMLQVASALLGERTADHVDAEAYVLRVRRRLLKRMEEDYETTEWSLDGDEEAEEGVYAEADIPQEIEKVRELIRLVPQGPDRRFDTVIRAISELTHQNPDERFIIFTQYRDTLEFLSEELGKIYGSHRLARIVGGPLEDKIAAMEAFWAPDGARFLISTSAGGEGINLQIGHIVFNYDLPWNPMAVEQRIGRIHRYGQEETVQVYNLLAQDTVEEQIYGLLEHKLFEIARSIGKTDAQGRPLEDFRSEILGYLGSRPDYQDLYKRALVDRDYRRTDVELQRMIQEALRAREALDRLAQDLGHFNLEHYRTLKGRYSLAELGEWARMAILRLGGGAIPTGEFWTFICPEPLQRKYRLLPRYEKVCFDRDVALRHRACELGGIGHPLVDALLEETRSGVLAGDVADLKTGTVCARYLIRRRDERGLIQSRVVTLIYDPSTPEVRIAQHFPTGEDKESDSVAVDLAQARAALETALEAEINNWLPSRQSRIGLSISLVGLHK